jgi:hypothetical protein
MKLRSQPANRVPPENTVFTFWLPTELLQLVQLLLLTAQSDSFANRVQVNLLLRDAHLALTEMQQDILDNLAARLVILNFTVPRSE